MLVELPSYCRIMGKGISFRFPAWLMATFHLQSQQRQARCISQHIPPILTLWTFSSTYKLLGDSVWSTWIIQDEQISNSLAWQPQFHATQLPLTVCHSMITGVSIWGTTWGKHHSAPHAVILLEVCPAERLRGAEKA